MNEKGYVSEMSIKEYLTFVIFYFSSWINPQIIQIP